MMTSIVHLSSNRSYAEITWAIVAKLDSCMRHAYHFVMRTNSIQSIKKLQYRMPYVRNKNRRTSKFSKRNTKKMFYIVPVLYTCLGVFCRYLSTVCIDLPFSQLFRSAIHPHWFLRLFWVVFYHLWSLFLYCNIFSLVIRVLLMLLIYPVGSSLT